MAHFWGLTDQANYKQNDMKVKYLILGILVTIAAIIIGCEATKKAVSEVNAFPISDDIKLGKQVSDQIAADPKQFPILPESSNQEVYRYVFGIRDKILNTGKVKYKNSFKWELKIIDDDNTLNAFVTPGGYIYIYTGLIKFLDSEDQLAGVMGHEIAHADRRHATRQMTKSGALGMLSEAVLGDQNAVGQVVNGLIGLKFSRSSEEEADQYSVSYLCGTNYNADGAAGFFTKMKGKGGAPPKFLSTHPVSADRIRDIKLESRKLGCKGRENGFSEYAKIKNLLK